MEKLKDICFAQLAKMYTSARRVTIDEESIHKEDDKNDDSEADDPDEEDESEAKFNYIMTFQQVRRTKLPNDIL